MRVPSIFAGLGLATLVSLQLSACGAGEPAPAPASSTGEAAPPPAPAAAPPAAPADAPLAGDLIVSTNEPFWQATIDGAAVGLRGIEHQRRLDVVDSTIDGDTRTVRASDASGVVELRVVATPCQDSMSGAMFPFGAVLVIDGAAPVNGCARPASMPPPGEPQ
ncbi:hypothetical protein [Pseudoxanthomonas sp. 10H]|uniref:hypothetical protein n=1 Tax=Pseudoxanthomonas sp. 10H TaxID=3242729 RepID=UPI003558D04E